MMTTLQMKKLAGVILFFLCPAIMLMAQSTAPSNMTSYRGKNGTTYLFYVTGTNDGRFWGGQDNIYTDDSPLGVAAVHAGLLKAGETKAVKVTVLAGQASYPSITRNGLTSIKYGKYDGSYKLSAPAKNDFPSLPDNMKGFRGQNGKSYTFSATGKTNGRIWGGQNNIYTDDSDIATAVVHAGLLKSGQKGTVTIKVLSGQNSYPSLSRNGVTSNSYGRYDGSYQLVKTDSSTTPSPKTTDTSSSSGSSSSGSSSSTSSSSTSTSSGTKVAAAQNAPRDMTSYRGKNGTTYLFKVTGADNGRFWGGQDNIYTDDSPLGVAAVHAGLLKSGETKVIKVTVLAGQSSYPSITRNGLTSIKYGAWHGSYQLSAADQDVEIAPENMKNYRAKNGQTFTFRVTGKTNGRIWGGQNNIYTDDSDIATAVVHAGLLKSGQSGTITIKVLSGQNSYPSLSRNGVTSISYGRWDGSYQIVGIER